MSQVLNKRGLYFGRRSTRVHVAIYRLSGGKLGGHFPGLPSVPILLLDHTGARTGVRRTSPVMCQREGESFVIAASKAGQPTNPAWFHNIKANPETTIQIGRERRDVRARVATGPERERLWAKLVTAYPGYEFYEEQARSRQIPVVVLESRRAQ
jgi:deazaflavin-dependent oxidoreductase (nitroreductase family)